MKKHPSKNTRSYKEEGIESRAQLAPTKKEYFSSVRGTVGNRAYQRALIDYLP